MAIYIVQHTTDDVYRDFDDMQIDNIVEPHYYTNINAAIDAAHHMAINAANHSYGSQLKPLTGYLEPETDQDTLQLATTCTKTVTGFEVDGVDGIIQYYNIISLHQGN